MLGAAALCDDRDVVDIAAQRPFQLLAYLACRGGWVDRGALAQLLWPDRSDEQARGNLRFTLTRLDRFAWLEGFDARPDALRWRVQTDLAQFDHALAAGRHAEALERYGGPLLPGLERGAPPPFASWLAAERQQVQARFRAAALAVVQADPADAGAIGLAGRLLAADPFDEAALQALLRAHAAAGRGAAAVQVYREFAQRLHDELQIEPSQATRALHQTLFGAHLGEASAAMPGARRPSAAAAAADTLIGRVAECRQLRRWIEEDRRRLVTLTGPGGIGKTALARAVAGELKARAFVSLDGLASADDLVIRVARAFGVTAGATAADRIEALAAAMRGERALCVLDDFERREALEPCVALIGELLARCPALALLITSRSRLNVSGETVLVLDGLPCAGPGDDAALFDATRLFVERARRARADFDAASQLVDIAELCRLVDGMPLALELAAPWVRLLPCRTLVAEIRQGLQWLATDDPARAPHQRSIEATLAHAWRLLAPTERMALARLTVFEGGCTPEAAREVTEAPPPLLAALADKSWLRAEGGRLALHPLVARFAAAELAADDEARTRAAKLRYFVALAERWRAAWPREVRRVLQETADEQANLRSAWSLALVRWDAAAAESLGGLLVQYFVQVGSRAEGITFFVAAADATAQLSERSAEQERVLAESASRAAALLQQASRYADCETYARIALEAHRRLRRRARSVTCLNLIGLSLFFRGRHDTARPYLQAALRQARSNRHDEEVVMSCANLGALESTGGRYAAARLLYEEALAINARLDNSAGRATLLNNLGNLHRYQLDPAGAIPHYEAALALYERHGLRAMRCFVLVNLALCYLALSDVERAAPLAEEAVHEAVHHGVAQIESMATATRARILLRRHEPEAAMATVRQAMLLARDDRRLVFIALNAWAEILEAAGQPAQAIDCWALIAAHPQGESETRSEALRQLSARGAKPMDPARAEAELPERRRALLAEGEAAQGRSGPQGPSGP
jgi:DNA-binding SARP family transcriptional activator/predicted ATPase